MCVAKFLCVRNLKPESDLKYFLVAIRLLENKENVHSIEINKIINAFLSASKSPLLQVALFLSFVLVVNYPDLKPSLLLTLPRVPVFLTITCVLLCFTSYKMISQFYL